MPTLSFVAAVLLWVAYQNGLSHGRSSSSSATTLGGVRSLGVGPAGSIAAQQQQQQLEHLGQRHDQQLQQGEAYTASPASAFLAPLDDSRTLQFDLCNGFTNQRIALMSGAPAPAAAGALAGGRPACCSPVPG